MGQNKRDRTAAILDSKSRGTRAELIAYRIDEAGMKQLVAAGVIVEFDPGQAERLKVTI